MVKVCSRCGAEKPEEEFPIRRWRKDGTPGRYAYCRPCHSEYERENRIKRQFNLTPEQYALLVQGLDNKCAICDRPAKKLRLAIDHDHKTGLVRGLLCHRCNRLLGWVFDDADALERAAEYVRRPPAVFILGRPVFGRVGRVTKRRRKARKAA